MVLKRENPSNSITTHPRVKIFLSLRNFEIYIYIPRATVVVFILENSYFASKPSELQEPVKVPLPTLNDNNTRITLEKVKVRRGKYQSNRTGTNHEFSQTKDISIPFEGNRRDKKWEKIGRRSGLKVLYAFSA